MTRLAAMGRWEPNARGRLERAAVELYTERGFEQTTVADIAERAGLTKRTFFRHYADKRDVLFADADALQELIVKAIAETPRSLPPLAAVAAGLQAAAVAIEDNHEGAQYRQAVIAANPELQERQLAQLAAIAAAVAETLRARGVGDQAASLTAEVGVAAFKIAFACWISHPGSHELPRLLQGALDELKALTAGA